MKRKSDSNLPESKRIKLDVVEKFCKFKRKCTQFECKSKSKYNDGPLDHWCKIFMAPDKWCWSFEKYEEDHETFKDNNPKTHWCSMYYDKLLSDVNIHFYSDIRNKLINLDNNYRTSIPSEILGIIISFVNDGSTLYSLKRTCKALDRCISWKSLVFKCMNYVENVPECDFKMEEYYKIFFLKHCHLNVKFSKYFSKFINLCKPVRYFYEKKISNVILIDFEKHIKGAKLYYNGDVHPQVSKRYYQHVPLRYSRESVCNIFTVKDIKEIFDGKFKNDICLFMYERKDQLNESDSYDNDDDFIVDNKNDKDNDDYIYEEKEEEELIQQETPESEDEDISETSEDELEEQHFYD